MHIALVGVEATQNQYTRLWLESGSYLVTAIARWNTFQATFPLTPYAACLIELTDKNLPQKAALMRLFRRCKAFLMPVLLITSAETKSQLIQTPWFREDDFILCTAYHSSIVQRLQLCIKEVRDSNQNLRNHWDKLYVDYNTRRIFLEGQLLRLTRYETVLALHLLCHIGETVTRDYLMENVWVENADMDTRKIDVHVCALRRKLKLVPAYGWKLSSVYGKGYRLLWLGPAEPTP